MGNSFKLVIIYQLILFSYIFTLGFYSLGSVLLLLVAFTVLAYLYFSKGNSTQKENDNNLLISLKYILVTSITISLVVYGGLYQKLETVFTLSTLILVISSFLSISYFTSVSPIIKKYRFRILFVSAVILQVFMILSSPHPKIDVFDQLKYGTEGLTNLKNPYSQTFPQIYNYPQDYFPYLPLTVIVFLPFNLIFGDPRFALIAAYILTGVIFKRILRKDSSQFSELIPLIFLFNPRATFMTEQAWIDPLIFAFFITFLYSLENRKNQWLSGIILGITIGLKQTFPLLLIFLFAYKKIPKKILIISILILILSVIPFFLWNQNDFLNDVIKIHLDRRLWWHNSLTVNSLMFSEFKFDVNKLIFPLIWMAVLFTILKKRIDNIATLILAISLWFFAFYLFNYQAYIHYYHFISSMLLVTIAFCIRKNEHTTR